MKLNDYFYIRIFNGAGFSVSDWCGNFEGNLMDFFEKSHFLKFSEILMKNRCS